MTKLKNMDERINIDAFKEVMNDHEYRNYVKKIRVTENKIIRIIGNGKLLGECEELISLANMIQLEKVYKMGFQDGKNELKVDKKTRTA
ncbi:MAG: hypothetical protein APF81_20755 [Desulfosporosinus sp. BRH_c37]|nr:MAG: hypothetical protein APF81_20755 [Desulfosporosinus sp. BRH_c37]